MKNSSYLCGVETR